MRTENEENRCVHTEHCCVVHGCKYGEEYCPVEQRHKRQSYLCERCVDIFEEDNKQAKLQKQKAEIAVEAAFAGRKLTTEEKVKPKLRAIVEEAGMEITLKLLIGMVEESIIKNAANSGYLNNLEDNLRATYLEYKGRYGNVV